LGLRMADGKPTPALADGSRVDRASVVSRSGGPRLRDVLGPGLITGASDDDPSGIATYSQAGAQFGFGLTWTLLFTYPLMVAIQQISAEIGRVTGAGLAGNLRRHFPHWLLVTAVALLLIANTINIGADLGAMGDALALLIGGPNLAYVIGFSLLTALLEVFLRYSRYVEVLRWLTVSLFAYVATAFVVQVPWRTVAISLIAPQIRFDGAYLTVVVGVLGTTISPYLFFWQAGQEVEDEQESPTARPLLEAPDQAPRELQRIRLDTVVGMGLSNLVALFIVITTAATLHAHGVTDIQTSAQAAGALRPLAGEFAFALFSMGIIGTGLLTVPVLAGSAAYALGEALGWTVGLTQKPARAKAFYLTIAVATLLGMAMNVLRLDPVKALFWSAVVNGVVAVPLMAMIMLIAVRPAAMGQFVIGRWLRGFGWLATAVMGLAAAGMFATWGD
jgi:NRAMP (natural resistance-associated macrophage protein)-like metal ion transporter